MQKKSARMRARYFVRTQYGVIKIKSLSYISNGVLNHPNLTIQALSHEIGHILCNKAKYKI
ncbi:hypothetical protein [Arsenophonus endosymbiont of Bemisia tabaci]|uniref:hypothetical protein n=1 Tax=Arsenophonus endosymbiont of Bemisia tabaci TaxID=536059 RepID=UPI0015F42B38|nr:hypothetical protein [Arsenophonus endosymbiont of Bemisia tabaci]CAA2929999.1 hypothetical protein ARSQ2_01112 [Arsenophonus endosymbiont of Bemisia tabaci Q2]